MRSTSLQYLVPAAIVLALAAATATAAGCTTASPSLPDARIFVDSGMDDGGSDAGFPDPVIDPCEDPGGTVGDTCETSAECDDQCFCNGAEVCTGGVCALGSDPCVDTVECTEEACLEETNTCFHMPNDSRCSNGMACDGYERCDRVRDCVPAADLYCNDESACTVDSCDDAVGCVFTPRDLDEDGYLAGSCGGDDCDDDPRYGRMIFPGAPEVCDNRRDDNCDGRRDYNDTACRPSNDTCELATVLPERSGTFSGSTAGLTSNYAISCASGTGPDAVFHLTLTAPHDVRVGVSGIAGASVALRDWGTCSAGPDLKCSNAAVPSVLHRSLPVGEYAIIVRTPSGGSFDLSMMITDPTPIPPIDVCGAGTEQITATGIFRGRFEETSDDYRLQCHTGTFRDAAYRLVLTEPSDVILTATTSGAAFGGSTAYVSLLTNCSDAASTMSCQFGGPAEVRRRGLAAGTYYVLVEPGANDSTDWQLNATITSPPAPRAVGDACGTAVPVTLTASGTTETGSATAALATAELDSGTSCGGTTPGNADVYFSFRLDSTRDVTLTTNGAGFHYVALQSTCGSIGSDLRCRSGSSPYSQIFRSLPAGTYYVAVATTLRTGTVTTTVETRPPTPVPPNDRCSGAIDMSAGGLRRDTLIGFEDDLAGGTCSPAGAVDGFYRITLTEPQVVTIIATPVTGTSQAYITLRDSCSAGTALACAAGTGSPPGTTLVRELAAGTYYVMVEMFSTFATDVRVRVLIDPV
jgi:hypothetical protein